MTTGKFKKERYGRNELIKDRLSVGIACCRFNNGKPEILLVCKRYSYALNLITQGKYDSNNDEKLIKLFNGLYVEEKLDLKSLNFTQIRYRVWLDNVIRNGNYFMAKNKFDATFVADGGVRLKKLLAKSSCANKIWEIPKGRKINRSEPDVHAAIREFREETGIDKKNYKIFLGAKRSYSYVDDGVKYTNIYYLAFTRHHFEPKIKFDNVDQVDEICDIKWMNIERIRMIDDTGRLENFVRPIFNFMKKYAK